MAKRVTQRDLARLCGTSVSTVSRALLGHPRIPEATRERICRAAEEAGYQPDPVVSQIARSRWQSEADTIGIMVPFIYNDPTRAHMRDPTDLWFRSTFEGVVAAAKRIGYRVEPFNLVEFGTAACLHRILQARGVRGLVLAPVYYPEPCLDLPWERYSAVCLGPGFYPLPLHQVYFSAFEQMEFALERIQQRGYRRIGVSLMAHASYMQDDRRRMGAIAAFQKRPEVEVVPPFIYDSNLRNDGIGHPFLQWYDLHRPDAILGSSNFGYWYLKEDRRLRCPQDFGFAVLHSVSLPNEEFFSGVAVPQLRIGQFGLRLLDMLLRTNETGLPSEPITHHVGLDWHEGQSLPAIAPSSTAPGSDGRSQGAAASPALG